MSRARTPVVAWPKVEAVLDSDGSAQVSINGARQTLSADDVTAARRAVIELVAESTAAALERPVMMEVADPDGSWLLLVHPDGEVESLEDRPPARRHRRRIGRRSRLATADKPRPGPPPPQVLAAPPPGGRAKRRVPRRVVLGVAAVAITCVGAIAVLTLPSAQPGPRPAEPRIAASPASTPEPSPVPSAEPEAHAGPERPADRPRASRRQKPAGRRRARRTPRRSARARETRPRRPAVPARTPQPGPVAPVTPSPPSTSPPVPQQPSDEFGP